MRFFLPAGAEAGAIQTPDGVEMCLVGEMSSLKELLQTMLGYLILLSPTIPSSSFSGSPAADLTYDEYCRLTR